MFRHMLCAVFALALLAPLATARAAYPERPITMIVPFPPGGGADIAGRVLARHLERTLGQPVIVLNRPGAAGEIGFTALAKAQPDGYTIGVVTTPNVVVQPIQRPTQFKLSDLAPIANLVEDIGIFFVRKDSRFHDIKELVAFAREHPGKLNIATTGIGGPPHFALLFLQESTGSKVTAVPYSGTAPIRQAVMAGDVDAGFITISEAEGDLQAGSVRALGQAGEKRAPNAPNIPTLREQAVDVVISALRGIAAPAQTPPSILRTLSDAIADVVRDPEFQKSAASMPLRFIGTAEFARELARQDAKYRALWKTSPWGE